MFIISLKDNVCAKQKASTDCVLCTCGNLF